MAWFGRKQRAAAYGTAMGPAHGALPQTAFASPAAVAVAPPRSVRRDQFFSEWQEQWGHGGRGGFASARRDRLTDDWQAWGLPPGVLHRADAKLVRDRAIDLVDNNPLASSAVSAYAANVIETGITPRPQFADREQRRIWTRAWRGFSTERRELDIRRIATASELQELFLREVIVKGGCLVHYVDVDRRRNRRRQYSLAQELIGEERFCDAADAFANVGTRAGKNPIHQGVEIDRHTGEPVAYWVWPFIPGEIGASIADPVRLPAEDCEYAYLLRRVGQYRGFSLLAPAIVWLWKLGYYADNELMNSAIASCFSMVIKTDNPDTGTLAGDSGDESTDDRGNQVERVEPGMVLRLKPHEDAAGISPGSGGSQALPWITFISRSIAASMDLSYEAMMRDTSQANFSQARMAQNEDRKRYRRLQSFVIDHKARPDYQRFVEAAVRRGEQGFPGPEEYLADPEGWLEVNFRTPGWDSVNPVDDAKANDINLKNRTTTRERIMAAAGEDWEEGFEQLDREEQLLDGLGLDYERPNNAAPFGASPAPAAAPGGQP